MSFFVSPAPRLIYSVLFFVLATVLLFVARPDLVFDPATGRPRPFGVVEKDETVFSLGVVVCAMAVLSLYAFALIDVAYSSSSSASSSASPPPAYSYSASHPPHIAPSPLVRPFSAPLGGPFLASPSPFVATSPLVGPPGSFPMYYGENLRV